MARAPRIAVYPPQGKRFCGYCRFEKQYDQENPGMMRGMSKNVWMCPSCMEFRKQAMSKLKEARKMTMSVSERCVEFSEMCEVFRPKAYLDSIGAGTPWTIGFGSTYLNGEKVREGMTITREEAHNDVVKRFAKHAISIFAKLPPAVAMELTQGRMDALASFLDNVGPGLLHVKSGLFQLKNAPSPSTLWSKVCLGDWDGARDQIHLWDSNGIHGLKRRRRAEEYIWDGMDPIDAYHRAWSEL